MIQVQRQPNGFRDAPPTPTSPSVHVQAIHDFDPSRLASTSANTNTYLSFRAGEIIRVHVQDTSGWWDGEITGETDGLRRGWFPSNYVKEMTNRPKSRNDSVSTTHTRTTSTTSHQSRASTRQALPESLQQLLHPVVQALSLLESAIHSNHKTHIQPSTACVISSIRSALQQSDCLSKESQTLAKWPILGKERKIVLLELSRMVAYARTASGAEGETENPEADMEALQKSAKAVFASVKRLFHMANECGVQPNPLMATPMSESLSEPVKTTTKALSLGDLRAARKASSPPPPVPSIRAASAAGRARSPSITTPVSATFTSSSGRSSSISMRSSERRHFGSIDSNSTGYSSELETPIILEPQTSTEVHDAIGIAEDALLSIIAAFIGHIHSHHMGSHPSSHANLIEMTKETIDAVRQVLTIVEAVGRHPSLRQNHSREIDQLRTAKNNLYDVASRLVEGAEMVANESDTMETYDQVKARLLQTATGTLRAGTECVRLVRQCVIDDDLNVTPRPAGPSSTSRPIPDSSLVLRDKVVGERGMHTLSALHRKASSLSQLQQRYLDDTEAEELTERDEDLTMVPTRPDLLRTQSEDSTKARSRASSLSSPAPPRMTHRSPSRSADLDKFTSDFTLPSRLPHASTLTRTSSSSGIPVTPSTGSVDSPMLGYLKNDSGLIEPIDTDATPGKRPPMPARSVTAPVPSANTDVRFWVVAHDYDPKEITFNPDGNIIGASLAVLVEKMTPHDVPPEPTFWQTFFFTFRLFTTPTDLLSSLMTRYDLLPPAHTAFGERERAIWIERKVVPVRLRIYNLLKAWLETHWRQDTDDVILDTLQIFVTEVIARTLPAMAPRLQAVIRKRLSGPLTALSEPERPLLGGLPPTPIISKSLNSMLQKNTSTNIPITEFDTLELARQLTLLESKLFCCVSPEDLLQTGKKTIPELKALSTISNQITGWVADNVLNEIDAKKRAGLLKFYIKLADKCLLLNNFSTLFALLAGLNSSIVTRLKKTWDALPSKYRVIIDRLQGVIEHTKNHAAYRALLREVDGPCLPFLGLILTDITFTAEGNPDVRPSVLAPEIKLVNQDKYAKLGRIAIDFTKYQQPFNFHELEAVQMFLRRVLAERGSHSLDALYRKSLMLEPRKGTEKITSAVEKPGWLGGKI